MMKQNEEQTRNKKQITKEIFSPVVKKFQRIKITPHYKDECWSIDLVDKSSLAKYNKGYKFIFTIIDNYSKYAWAIPIKDKQGITVKTAFEKLLQKGTKGRKPEKIWSDRGKEFYNKPFLDFLKKNNISIYSTNSDLKAVFIERFNRTLMDLIKEPMYIEGKACWLDHLKKALEVYNNRKHYSTKMTPFEASETPYSVENTNLMKTKGSKFQVCDLLEYPIKLIFTAKGI